MMEIIHRYTQITEI